jgi:hypothetical protein
MKDDDQLFWHWITLWWSFTVGFLAAALFAWYLSERDAPQPYRMIVPCAVPVFVQDASTLEELEARSALNLDAMRACENRVSRELERK